MKKILEVRVWDEGDHYHTQMEACGTGGDLLFAMSEILHNVLSQVPEDLREMYFMDIIKRTIHHD